MYLSKNLYHNRVVLAEQRMEKTTVMMFLGSSFRAETSHFCLVSRNLRFINQYLRISMKIEYVGLIRVSSRIFCLGGKNSLESLTTPTFVGTLYWHVINLFCTTLGY